MNKTTLSHELWQVEMAVKELKYYLYKDLINPAAQFLIYITWCSFGNHKWRYAQTGKVCVSCNDYEPNTLEETRVYYQEITRQEKAAIKRAVENFLAKGGDPRYASYYS